MALLKINDGRIFEGDSIIVWPEINGTVRITIYKKKEWPEVVIVDAKTFN